MQLSARDFVELHGDMNLGATPVITRVPHEDGPAHHVYRVLGIQHLPNGRYRIWPSVGASLSLYKPFEVAGDAVLDMLEGRDADAHELRFRAMFTFGIDDEGRTCRLWVGLGGAGSRLVSVKFDALADEPPRTYALLNGFYDETDIQRVKDLMSAGQRILVSGGRHVLPFLREQMSLHV